jgi:hypothetical protein
MDDDDVDSGTVYHTADWFDIGAIAVVRRRWFSHSRSPRYQAQRHAETIHFFYERLLRRFNFDKALDYLIKSKYAGEES